MQRVHYTPLRLGKNKVFFYMETIFFEKCHLKGKIKRWNYTLLINIENAECRMQNAECRMMNDE